MALVALLAFGGGAATMHLVQRHAGHRPAVSAASPASRTRAAPPSAAQEQAVARAFGELVAPTRAVTGFDPSDPDAFAKLHAEARKSGDVRRELLEQYAAASEGDAKRMLGVLLSTLQFDDVVSFAEGLARSEDVARRRDGYELLARLGMKLPEVRQLARGALAAETDPGILARAIAAIQPAAVDEAESAAVVGQLRGFVGHADPAVRAQALETLAAWDKAGETADVLGQGLGDVETSVRWSAIAAIAKNRVRSPELKESLMAMAGNPDEDPDLRLGAARALESFSLDTSESAQIVRAAMEADRRLYANEAE